MAIKIGSSLAAVNNNPGNLRFAGQNGASEGQGGFAKFESPEAGYEALKNQIKLDASRGNTLGSFINKYAPPTENNTGEYITQATQNLGAKPEDSLSSIDLDKMGRFMAQKESSTTVENKFEVKFENGKTVTFDSKPTPQDIEEVAQKMGITKTPDTTLGDTNKPQQEGIVPSIIRGITQPVATMLARPVQAIAQLAGVSNEDINAASSKVPFYGEGGRLDMPTGTFNKGGGAGKDIVKSAGQGLQTVSLGMPAGKIGQAAIMGATAGLGSGLEQEQSIKSGLLNSAIGAGGGLLGGSLVKGLEWLPKSLTGTAFNKMSKEQINRTLATKSIGSMSNIIGQSDKTLDNVGSQIGNIIRSVKNKPIITGQDILNGAVKDPAIGQQIMDTGLDLNGIQQSLKLAAPTKKGLVDKLFSEGLSLDDLHRLNSAIGKSVFKTNLGQSPEVVRGKALGALLYGENSKIIQGADKRLPKLFEEYSKEIQLQKVLNSAANKSKGGLINWKDIVPFMAGSSLAGLPGGLVATGIGRAAENPAVQFGAAKILQGANKATSPVLNRFGLLPSILKRQSQPLENNK